MKESRLSEHIYMYVCRWVGVCVCQNVCNIPHKGGGGGGGGGVKLSYGFLPKKNPSYL